MPIDIRKAQPAIPISVFNSWSSANNCVKTLLISTSIISLADMPMTKASPPRWPLFRLCLIVVNNTGPTAMLNKSPRPMPCKRLCNIVLRIAIDPPVIVEQVNKVS